MKKLNLLNISFFATMAFFYIIGFKHFYNYFNVINGFTIPFNLANLFTFFLIGVLFIFFLVNIKNNINRYTMVFFFIIMYILLYNLFYSLNYIVINENTNAKILQHNFFLLSYYLLYFLVGYYYRGYRRYQNFIYILYVLMTLNVFMHMNDQTLLIDFSEKRTSVYQFLGDSYAIIALLTISLLNNRKIQLIVIMFSIVTLFMLVSRSSFYVFILVGIIYLFAKERIWSIIYIFIITTLILLFFVNGGEFVDKIMNSRLLIFLTDKVDQSTLERFSQIDVGLNAIKEYWIIGDFGGDVLYFNRMGNYMHNYLSLLRQYGIIPFAFFLFLIVNLLKKSFLWFKNIESFSIDYDFFMLLTFFTLIEITVAKSIQYPIIFMPLGILAALNKKSDWIYKKYEGK